MLVLLHASVKQISEGLAEGLRTLAQHLPIASIWMVCRRRRADTCAAEMATPIGFSN
jgi:hypothetical protein